MRAFWPAFAALGMASVCAAPPAGPAAAPAAAPEETLRPGAPAEVYLAPGRATTILLRTAKKVAAISVASPVVSYKYDKALNQLELTPAARAGGTETNLNLRIGAEVYVILARVVNDVRAQYLRVFALEGDSGSDDEAGLARARPRAPAEVDLVGAARAIERAQSDPVFRDARPGLRLESLDQAYAWNGCIVVLADVAQFPDLDLLVFRIRWVNRTDDALYLDPSQYGLFADGRRIPVIARYKPGAGPIVFPGQLETVYLAVQGYRLSRRNRWQLGLPPDAAELSRLRPGAAAP